MSPIRILAAALLGAAAGCGGASARPRAVPAATAHAWAAAERADDARAAYDLLADAARRDKDFDAFRAEWLRARDERGRQASSVERTLREGAEIAERAELRADALPPASLVRDVDGWRLERPLLATTRAGTPEDALRLFATAVDERSVAGVLRILTSARRSDVRHALDTFVAGIKGHLGESIEVTGDRATLVWHDGDHRWRVTLKREEGEWRIDDFSAQ